MLIGSFGGLPQFNIKRILSYSSLVNSGYILLCIYNNNEYSLFTYIFYIIQYSINHFLIFMIILFITMYHNNLIILKRSINNININDYSQNNYLIDILGLYISNKTLSIIFIISLTSFIGLPPLLGFYGKFNILIKT